MGPTVNLADVYVFKKVASTLSFTKAARQMGISRSAVSKQVNRLEHDLGVVLVNRTTRSVNLTEAGRTFDSNTSDIDTTIEHAADLVRGADLSPLGTVAFALPSSLGAALLPALTTEFQRRWPELRLNLQFDDFGQDIIANNLDLAVRVSSRLSDSSLISKRLATTRMVFAAAPHYLSEVGMPANLSELQTHRCIGLGSPVKMKASWHVTTDVGKVSMETGLALSANNELAMILAACLGGGVIRVPEICIASELARNQLQLVDSLTDTEQLGVYALYPHRNAAAKVKILVEFIENKLSEASQVDRWAPLINFQETLDALASHDVADNRKRSAM